VNEILLSNCLGHLTINLNANLPQHSAEYFALSSYSDCITGSFTSITVVSKDCVRVNPSSVLQTSSAVLVNLMDFFQKDCISATATVLSSTLLSAVSFLLLFR
jgi:hypothetical protein